MLEVKRREAEVRPFTPSTRLIPSAPDDKGQAQIIGLADGPFSGLRDPGAVLAGLHPRLRQLWGLGLVSKNPHVYTGLSEEGIKCL
jgi:hypothetical protein